MTLARTDTFDQRSAIFAGLVTRNRVIGVLRVLVPLAGLAAFVALAAEIYVANTLRQYGVAGIRIDRGALVVDGPQYTAAGPDGAHYSASARQARAPLGDAQFVTMESATLAYDRPGRPTLHLSAPVANADLSRNVVTIPGIATLSDEAGLHGTLDELEGDLQSGVFTARGPVAIAFRNGATIAATSMRFDSSADTWTLTHVTFTAPGLPEASP